ncbi:MAG: OB-fold nucleic acid binding domain-containing protein, partial [bacterium]
MPKQLIADLKEGDPVSSFFQVEQVQLYDFRSRQGKYAVLQLADRTGAIRGVCWDDGEKVHGSFPPGSIARLEGRVEYFNEQLQ